MKTTIQQLSKNFAAKAGLDVQVNTFAELENLLRDLIPVIKFNDNNEDINTSSLDAMLDGYFSECYTPNIRITAQKEVIAKLMKVITSDCYDFEIEGEFDIYEELSNVPDGAITIWDIMEYDKMSDVFEQLRTFSESEQTELSVLFTNVTPKNEDKDSIRYIFNKGIRTGGGVIRIEESNSAWYPLYLYWLCYAFKDMSMEEVSAMGIEIEVQ